MSADDTCLGEKIDISTIPDVELKPHKLHEASIIEFTIIGGMHFKLALCERELWGANVQRKYLYVSDDMETYCKLMDFHGIGVPMFYYMRAEGFKLKRWIQQFSKEDIQ